MTSKNTNAQSTASSMFSIEGIRSTWCTFEFWICYEDQGNSSMTTNTSIVLYSQFYFWVFNYRKIKVPHKCLKRKKQCCWQDKKTQFYLRFLVSRTLPRRRTMIQLVNHLHMHHVLWVCLISTCVTFYFTLLRP